LIGSLSISAQSVKVLKTLVDLRSLTPFLLFAFTTKVEEFF
jgi:hypothetical protein